MNGPPDVDKMTTDDKIEYLCKAVQQLTASLEQVDARLSKLENENTAAAWGYDF